MHSTTCCGKQKVAVLLLGRLEPNLPSLRPLFILPLPPSHPLPPLHTMASALRLSRAFGAAAPLRTTAFNGLRCYSSKTTVGSVSAPSPSWTAPLIGSLAVAQGDVRQQAAWRD